MFKCRLCQSVFQSIEDHCRHIDLNHSVSSNPSITCGFATCTAKVRGLVKYLQHFEDFHNNLSESSVDDPSHKCAYSGCNYTAKTRSTLRSHFFWNHPSTKKPLDGLLNHQACASNSNFESEGSFSVCDQVDVRHEPEVVEQEYTEEILLKKLVHMNLTANSKFHVPDSTLAFMLEGYRRLLFENGKLSEKILKTELELLGHSDAVSQNICDKVLFEPGLLKLHGIDGPLRSHHMRKKQYQKFFPHVPPTSHNLGLNDQNKKCKYHTVSLLQSLQAFFEDDSVYEQYCQRKSMVTTSDDLSDICHGTVFQNNQLFSSDPSAIQLIVFQDDVEMGNTLGPAGGMYKLLHIAYTLGNLFPWNRSKVDPIQLMLLCKDKDVAYFGLPRVLQPLLDELKQLEEIGVEIRGQQVKGSILVLEGDNLGTHTIGGFSAGFATSHYICRYCVESRQEWRPRWFPTAAHEECSESESSSSGSSSSSSSVDSDCSNDEEEFENASSSDDDIPLAVVRETLSSCSRRKNLLRSTESYDDCVKKLDENNPSGVLGVVAKCAFNDLKYFHIAKGSPPCIAHDIFEGVVPYDLNLCVKKLMKGKFSYDYLNRKLKSFPFQGSDVLDRPPSKFNSKRKKVKGSAVQNWVFLRFLPLLIGDRIVKEDNPVWDMVLMLNKIVSLLMSPVISKSSVGGYIDKLIQEYLHLRCAIFPSVPLRPKHKYFEHYSELTEMYGPLSRCSTLRFESKHKFFRSEIRSKKCMKNITKTLANGHQLLQSSLKVGEMFSSCPIVESPISFGMLDVPVEVKTCLLSSFGPDYVQTLFFAEKLIYHNTEYKTGNVLVTSTSKYPDVDCCLISILVSDGKTAYAVGTHSVGRLVEKMQIFEIFEKSKISMYALDTLKDYAPYPRYSYRDKAVFVLKHLYLKK